MPYFVVAGVLAAKIMRRQLIGLLRLNYQWKVLLFTGLIGQLFINIIHHIPQPLSMLGTELFFALTILSMLRNYRISGMIPIILGACLNFLEICLNHGAMPVLWEALRNTPLSHTHLGSRHVILQNSRLWWLSDWVYVRPFMMSIGDLFVGIGLIVFIVFNSEGTEHDRSHMV